jgi:pimeloyl-ACP methyl ester carboxylesterase
LIPKCPVPLDILWGDADPWELVAWGRELASDANVQKYTELPGVGHCPQDEAPDVVNPLIKDFVMRNA